MRELFSFTEDFQNVILACMVRHFDKIAQYGQILKPEYFTGTKATIAAAAIFEYQKSYSRMPTWEVLHELVAEQVVGLGADSSETARREAGEYVVKLSGLNTGDVDYVVTKVVEFARERATIRAIHQSIEAIKTGKDVNHVKLFEAALAVGQNVDDMGYLLHADSDLVVDKITATGYGVSSGYKLLDDIWRFGWGPGWLIVPLAPPKCFKTGLCINLALNIAGPMTQGDVLYYPCEISQELACARALYHLSGKSQNYMFDSPEKFKLEARENIQRMVAGNVLIKGFASKTATIQDLRAHARTAVRQFGLKPKAIIIDYAETIAPSDKTSKDYRQQADIYTEARAFGAEFGACVIMPDRCNKETVGKAVPDMRSFQGAFEKAGIVDAAIGICGTEEERLLNTIRLFVFLNRHGRQFDHIRGRVDPETMRIELLEKIAYEPEDDNDQRRGRTGRRGNLPEDLQ